MAVSNPAQHYLPSRLLKINVGPLLSEGPGNSLEFVLDLPRTRVAEDLTLDYIQGPVRLSRNHEGILVQAELLVGVEGECYRCLRPIAKDLTIDLEELYATDAELKRSEDAEFSVGDDHQLDLAPLLRAEALIVMARGLRCDDVAGCDARMAALATEETEAPIDPRMAKLQALLNARK